MLNTEDRTTLVNYLAASASDAVIVEAFENARRENSHALVTLVNYQNEVRSSKARKEKVIETATVVTANTEPIVLLVPDDKLPSKLTAVGQLIIAALKRANRTMALAEISRHVNRPIAQIRPQLALAVKRKLVAQIKTDLFASET